MQLDITKEWFEKRSALEGNLEIGAGRRTSTVNLSAGEIAQLERLALEGLPNWARDRIEKLETELQRLRSDRAYVIGFNDGFAAASAPL